MFNSEYIYINTTDRFHSIKWKTNGEFVELGGEIEVSDETLFRMEKMEEVEGWELTDELTLMGL